MKIQRLLICNRGEIAVRIIRTCRSLGIYVICVYSQADKNALFVSLADEAHLLPGPSDARNTYLNMDLLFEIAKKSSAQAIHPGYGFLSENAEFSQKCEDHGILFVGPPPRAINAMGSKKEAKQMLSKHEPTVPLIPGYSGDDQRVETLCEKAKEVGFPLLIKASAGGGGKGMRVLNSFDGMKEELEAAKREAQNYFGDEKVLLERYFTNVRHIEIQIFGDTHGNVVHCFERDCSMQRRYQKVIEESPSPWIKPQMRKEMCDAAVRIGKRIGYVGAGTVEFIAGEAGFFFLEVNTRLQVEHPVTEMVTSTDLVEAQIRVAEGATLSELGLDNLSQKGHAIEVRLYAEDPSNNFFPCSGKIEHYQPVEGVQGLRYDNGVQTGSEVSIFYDPMISKLIAYGKNRKEATEKMKFALRNTLVAGLTTNIPFLLQLISLKEFEDGSYHTKFIEEVLQPSSSSSSSSSSPLFVSLPGGGRCLLATVGMLWLWHSQREKMKLLKNVRSGFRNNPYRKQSKKFAFSKDEDPVVVEYDFKSRDNNSPSFQVFVTDNALPGNGLEAHVELAEITKNGNSGKISCFIADVRRTFFITELEDPVSKKLFVHHTETGMHTLTVVPHIPPTGSGGDGDDDGNYTAPMHSKILKVNVNTGDSVKKGDVIIVVESMKMENKILAKSDGKVELFVKEGEMVEAGALLIKVG